MSRTPLADVERAHDRAVERAAQLHAAWLREKAQLDEAETFLEQAPAAEATLERLAGELFGEMLDEIESSLTQTISEILGQRRHVVAEREVSRGAMAITFAIENDGNREDIMRGQGGSVLNIVSTGLRLIALSQLDPARHRPFLVLDEQDCWLKPALVPRFMGVIRAVCEKLDIQVLVISHHPLDLFHGSAERIYELHPDEGEGGARVRVLKDHRAEGGNEAH